MDWLSVAMVALAGFVGGMLLVSRVGAWVAGLVLLLKSPSNERHEQAGSSLAQLFLHSGPWALALGIGALYYVASLPQPIWFWALLAGLASAIVILAAAVAIAHLRQRSATAPTPLTPERLLRIRRRFFWINTIAFGGFLSAGFLWGVRQPTDHIGFVATVVGACLAGGWLYSWFMWQWYGALLQAGESERHRTNPKDTV